MDPEKSILSDKQLIRMVLGLVENSNIAKSFDPCQPAQSAQADMCRNFSQMYKAAFSQCSGLRELDCLKMYLPVILVCKLCSASLAISYEMLVMLRSQVL